MLKAIGYIRVSTDEQAREGISLAAQAAKIRAYADLNDLELVEIIEDAGKSGKSLEREGIQALLAKVRSKEAQAVIVYKLDRLSRRVVDTLSVIEQVESAGAGFHSIQERVDTKSAIGRFFLTITAAYAQMERDTIAERTAGALAHKKAIGEHVGRVPYGFTLTGKTLTKSDAGVIAMIAGWRHEGMTLSEIASELTARGIPTQRGGRWQAKTISNILNRAMRNA